MPGRNYINGSSYRYGMNGQEKDDEIVGSGNSYDFGARQYDPRLGRWMSLDPLMAKYPGLSPYNFVDNNPIALIDEDGRDIGYSITKTKDGTTVIHVTVGAVIINKSKDFSNAGDMEYVRSQIESEVRKQYSEKFTGPGGEKFEVDFNINLRVGKSEEDIKKNDHVITLVDNVHDNSDQKVAGLAKLGGNVINAETEGGNAPKVAKLVSHELGHNLGLDDEYEYKKGVLVKNDAQNVMGASRGKKLENWQKQIAFFRFASWAKKDGSTTTIRNSNQENGDSKSESKTFTKQNSDTSK
jgi:RHS repeat-associated protein